MVCDFVYAVYIDSEFSVGFSEDNIGSQALERYMYGCLISCNVQREALHTVSKLKQVDGFMQYPA